MGTLHPRRQVRHRQSSLEPISPATPSHSATTCVGARTEGSGILLVTPMVQSQSDFDGGVCGSWFPQPQLAAVDGEGGRPRHPGRLFVHFGDRIQRRCTRTLDPISSAVTTVGIRCDHHGEEYGLDTTAATCPAPPTVSFAGALASSPIHLCPRQLHFEATAFS